MKSLVTFPGFDLRAVPATVQYDPEAAEYTVSNDVLRVAAAGRTESEARARFDEALIALLEMEIEFQSPRRAEDRHAHPPDTGRGVRRRRPVLA